MTFKLPDLPTASCRHFVACGTIVNDDAATLKWLKKHKAFEIAKVKSHGETVFVRAVIGHSFESHCHLDVARKELFKGVGSPETSKSWTAIQKMFEPLMGKTIIVEAEGLYPVLIEKLPVAIRIASMFDALEDGVGIKMTSGRLSVSGAPIYGITWRLSDDPDDKIATIRLEAKVTTEVDEDYLLRTFDIVRSGFESFIESGVPHGSE